MIKFQRCYNHHQTAIFFVGTAVFVMRIQLRCCLCFIWTSPSALTTRTSPPCVLTGEPPPRTHTGGPSVNLRWEAEERCAAFLSKGGGEDVPALKLHRSQVCISDSESNRADKNHFTYSAIYGQKQSQSKENGHNRHEAHRLGSCQAGPCHFPLIDWRTCLKTVQFLCHHWHWNTGFQEKQVTAPPDHANIQW